MIQESSDANLADKNPPEALARFIRHCLTLARGAKLSAISKTSLLGGLWIVVLISCAKTAPEPVRTPGIYGVIGWKGSTCFDQEMSCTDVDYDLQVGYPMTLQGPEVNCYPNWRWESTPTTIESGTLPPGMKFVHGRWGGGYGGMVESITGIPTERGHWIVKLRMGTILCNGDTYKGYVQDVRFHVTGTGVVR